MSILDELSSSVGDRTQNANRAVAERVRADPALLDDIARGLTAANVKLVGDCAEILTMTAQDQPEAVAPYLDQVIPLLAAKDKRVRWEAMHTLALIARHVAGPMAALLPQLREAIRQDTSTIVRGYAVEALGEYAGTSASAAQAAWPVLLEALTLWEGDYANLALVALTRAAVADPALAASAIAVAQQYRDHSSSRVKQAARASLRKLGQK